MKDYVICPICKKELKEINNSHLKTHSMSTDEFDLIYKDYDRLSETSRSKKATFTGKKHTDEYKQKMSKIHTGLKKGIKLTTAHKEKIGIASKKLWYEKYEKLARLRTLEGYIEKFGHDSGMNKWFKKNKLNSESSKLVNGTIDEYKRYVAEVCRITAISLRNFDLKDLNQRDFYNYHLDHKFSKCKGFNEGLSPYVIGSIYNLEIIPASKNTSKQTRCSITLNELLEQFEKCDFYKKLIDIENEIRS